MENNFCDTTAIRLDEKCSMLGRILSELARAVEAFAEIFADGDRMFVCFEVEPWKVALKAAEQMSRPDVMTI